MKHQITFTKAVIYFFIAVIIAQTVGLLIWQSQGHTINWKHFSVIIVILFALSLARAQMFDSRKQLQKVK